MRRLNYVKLHGGDAFIPGIGGLGSTLPSQSKTLDIKMYASDSGVCLYVNGRDAFIPWANVQLAVYDGESEFASVKAAA